MPWMALVSTVALLTIPCPPDLFRVAGFAPGPHAVGFRSVRLRDTARAWPSSGDPAGVQGRPIQISLWYPARPRTGALLTIEDYILVDWTGAGERAAESAARVAALEAARAAFDGAGDRALTDDEWARARSAPGRAQLGLEPLPGRRALLLLEPGLGGRSWTFLPLAEMLASHGYEVAALATFGSSETERLRFDLAGVRAQVDDMKVALRVLGETGAVDAARVGLVGWSAGGVSQALLRLERPEDFRAAVSLDSGTGYAYGADLLRQAGGFDPGRLSVPFLHVDVGKANVEVPKDDAFFRAHGRAATRRRLLPDLLHGDFALAAGVGRAAALQGAAPDGLRRIADELRLFLEEQMPPGFAAERVTIASDGWRLVGDLALPDAEQPAPAVLLLNKAAGDRAAYRDLAERLARLGIASLRLDLRGHGESTNLGRFVPAQGATILEGSDRDVGAALDMLRRHPRVDAARLAVVGASYSGEAMMQAARTSGYAAAYVGLSPGSLSDESIAAIDNERVPWLLVVSRDERHLKEVAQAFREQSRSGEFVEVSGSLHASDLLAAHPGLAGRIASWLRDAINDGRTGAPRSSSTASGRDRSR